MEKVKNLLLGLLNLPLYWIAKLVPKDENIWIFGSWLGEKYADNSKYLFEYINKKHPEIRAIWITKDVSIINKLKKEGYEVYKAYSIKSIMISLKAKCSIFVQSNKYDNLLFLNNSKVKKIQLWHGAPLKKIGFDDKIFTKNSLPKLLYKLKHFLFPFLNEQYDLVVAISEEDRKNFRTAFKVKKISITGYPRNDALFKFKYKKNKGYTVIYLPTFRGNIGDKIDLFSDFNFDIEKWNEILCQNNIVLNIKMHPVNKPKDELIEKYKSLNSISFMEEVDVAEILPNTDILITDYSSVFFDFLLTNRPIIFAPFDYEKYITKDRELYYDYDEVTPGPKCKNWDEVLEWIVKFKENPELYKEEREVIKNRFHKYQDGKNCERVYKEIIKINV